MSSIPPSFDHYAPPRGAELPEASAHASPVPSTLKAICIIAAVLGGLGLFGALAGAGGLALGQLVNNVGPGAPTVSPDAQTPSELNTQQRMQARMQETASRYLPWSILMVGVQFITALSLLIGGLIALKLKPAGRKLLMLASLVAVAYVLCSSTLYIMMQTENAGVLREMFQNMSERGAGPMGAFPKIMTTMLYVGIVFTLGLSLVKLSFYAITVVYMGKPPIKALYETAESSLVDP